jgi:hypothetical protein
MKVIRFVIRLYLTKPVTVQVGNRLCKIDNFTGEINKKKRLLIVAAVFLGGCFVLPLVDCLWFAFRVPADFANVQWRGNWNSEQALLSLVAFS